MSDIQLFGGLPEAELRRLVAVARRRRFGRGEVVFHQGDPADSLHLVVKGRFGARATTRLGDTVTIAILSPGEAFGELALVQAGARSMTVAALEAGETLAVNRDEFDSVRHAYPGLVVPGESGASWQQAVASANPDRPRCNAQLNGTIPLSCAP